MDGEGGEGKGAGIAVGEDALKCSPAAARIISWGRRDGIIAVMPGEAFRLPCTDPRTTARWIFLMLPDLQLGDRVRLRKPHACGGYEWRVVRLGADIGLECLTCGRRILLTRRKLARRLKVILPPDDGEPPDA